MNSSILLKIPKELRLHILEYVVEIESTMFSNWFRQRIFRVCRQLHSEAITVLYTTRDLTFELPDFNPERPHPKRLWFSCIDTRIQNEHLYTFFPNFLRPGEIGFRSRPDSPASDLNFYDCPFHLFRALRIEVPAPDPADPAQFIMTWHRLYWIGRMLGKARQGLPDVRLIFIETPGRSWFNASDGLLSLSHQDLLALSTDVAGRPSDLTLMLWALSPLRRARSISIRLPQGAEEDDACKLHVDWLRESAVKDIPFGANIDPEEWSDWMFAESLDHCELRMHLLLSHLETPIAPYLRLEQMASLTHFACYRLYYLSYIISGFPTRDETAEAVGDIINSALVKYPPPREFCPCCVETWSDGEWPEECAGISRAVRWGELREKWHAKITAEDTGSTLPSGTSADHAAGQPDLSVEAWVDGPELLDRSEEWAFYECACFRNDFWETTHPRGIAPYKTVMQQPGAMRKVEEAGYGMETFIMGFLPIWEGSILV